MIAMMLQIVDIIKLICTNFLDKGLVQLFLRCGKVQTVSRGFLIAKNGY